MTEFVITADIHFRESVPACRQGSFEEYHAEFLSKLSYVQSLLKKDGYILDGGDLFDHWKPSPWLISEAMMELDYERVITVPGNHDLPGNNAELLGKSGLNVLEKSGVIKIAGKSPIQLPNGKVNVYGAGYGEEIPTPLKVKGIRNVLLCHESICHDEPELEEHGFSPASKFLEKYMMNYDLIICGHNHKQFALNAREKIGGICSVVSPGSLMRMSINHEHIEPSVYIWDSKTGKLRSEKIPHQKDCFIETRANPEKKIDFVKFIRSLNRYKTDLKFEANVERFLKKNKVEKETENLLWEVIENGK